MANGGDLFSGIAKDALRIAREVGVGNPALQQALIVGRVLAGALGGTIYQLFGPRPQRIPYSIVPQDYPLTTVATDNSVATTNAQITTDSDFLWKALACVTGDDGTGAMAVRLQLRFTNTDQNWVNNQAGIHLASIINVRRDPYLLPRPMIVPRNTLVVFTTTNNDATARDHYLALLGEKIRDYNMLDLTSVN